MEYRHYLIVLISRLAAQQRRQIIRTSPREKMADDREPKRNTAPPPRSPFSCSDRCDRVPLSGVT